MKSLDNKIIIITGGSGLLGKAMVDNVRIKGGVAINADINNETDISNGVVNCDITSEESIIGTVNLIEKCFGRIDGLVNNAYPRTDDWGASFEDIPLKSWKTNVDWQMNSYFLFCQQVIKSMKKSGGGSIINIASIYGVVGNDFTIYEGTSIEPPAAYTAIKGGLINFSRFLASKYGVDGIRVNCISPGGIFDNQPEKFVEAYERKVPIKRMGNPDDIAPVVSFLLSGESGYITGQNIIVDGGWTAI
ncbi:SDR family oxidoreductase [Fulvivirga lutea]|uniref:SDR family oxidoreductase n=1 Tax=Fulvivirga lutea TaxID=2810512 RepID=A0A974WFJ5_9BACT|nr:SDR family oxidoreductase [Fulvivirga lutea]QSE96814.1 SDR family oxidoreductase [Fulvivirga lutea]